VPQKLYVGLIYNKTVATLGFTRKKLYYFYTHFVTCVATSKQLRALLKGLHLSFCSVRDVALLRDQQQ